VLELSCLDGNLGGFGVGNVPLREGVLPPVPSDDGRRWKRPSSGQFAAATSRTRASSFARGEPAARGISQAGHGVLRCSGKGGAGGEHLLQVPASTTFAFRIILGRGYKDLIHLSAFKA